MIDRKLRTNTIAPGLGIFAVVGLLLAASFGAATSVAAQGDNQQYVDVRIYAVTCDAARNRCERELGPRFTVTTEDGTYLGACTEQSARHPCAVRVPSGTMVVVTEDVSTIPAGTAPAENPLYFDTSTYPDAKSICCVVFENIHTDHDDDDSLVDRLVAMLVRVLRELLDG